MFTFSTLDWKQAFWTNVMENIKIACLCWNFVLTLLLICWFWWWCFRPKIPKLCKYSRKNQTFLFKLKSGINPYLSVLNTIGKFTFYFLDQKCSFHSNLSTKIKLVCLNWYLTFRLIWVFWFYGNVHFLQFKPEVTFFGKFEPKNHGLQYADFSADVHYSCYKQEIFLSGKYLQKNENRLF